LRLWLFAFAAALTVALPAAADDADTAFREGNEQYAAQRYVEAEQAYARAWNLKKTFDIATNLGHAERKLGKLRAAAEHFDFALRNYPSTAAVQAQRESLKQAFDDVKREVAVLHVHVNIDGADVTVDRADVGKAPVPPSLFVDAGPHEIVATLAGMRRASARVVASKGADQDVSLTLERDTVVAPPQPRPVSLAWPVAGGALALSGLALGVVGVLVANGKASDAARLQGSLGASTSVCAPPSNTEGNCAALQSDAEGRKTWSGVAAAGFITGGAFALATAGLLVWEHTRSGTSSARVEVGPVANTDHVGLLLRGAW
jgi:hypothetical protein